jgi:hypothetical protein
MGLQYAIDGVPLDSEHCAVTLGSSIMSGISVSRSPVQVPGAHGSIKSMLNPVFAERELTLKVTPWGPDSTGADSSRIARLCASPHPVITRVMEGISQQAEAELSSLQADDGGTVLGRVVPFTAVFAIPGVWWRGSMTQDLQLPSTGGLIYQGVEQFAKTDTDPGYRTMWDGMPDNSTSILFDRVSDGMFSDAPIPDLLLRMPKGVTSVAITDPVSGTGITWTGAADASRYLYVDAASQSAWRSASADAWAPASPDASNGVDWPPDGPLECWPNPIDGSYRLVAQITGSTDPMVVHVLPSWW